MIIFKFSLNLTYLSINRTGRTEENEFEDGSDSSVGDKYEGEEETPKKNKSKTTPLLTKPDKEVAPLFGTSEDILRFEVDFLLSLENLRGVSEDMEIQMEIFSLSKASENALEFDKAHRMRNGLHLLSDGVNMKGWTSKDIKVFLLDSDLKFVLLRRSKKTVSQLYNGAKPDGLCNLRTLLLLLERRRRFNAGRSDYNDVKDLDMTIPEDRISLLEHIKIWIAKVEGKYGIVTEEDQRVWTNQSSDVIKKLKCASKYVENISLLKSGSRIPSLGRDGWMIIDLTGFYDYDDCRVTVFEPLTKKDEETLFRLHFCGGYLHNSYSFPLRLIQEMTKQSNNCIFKDCHFFPLKTHPDDESHLFDLTLDNYCERLYDFLKISKFIFFVILHAS